MLSKLVATAYLVFVINGLSWNDEITLKNLKKVGTFKSFQEWQNKYNKAYDSMEMESTKYLVWLDNLKTIASTNSKKIIIQIKSKSIQ